MSKGEMVRFPGRFRRARAALGFALLLMACVATPVLADDPPVEPQEVLTSTAEVDPDQLPGPEDVTAGIEQAEEEEAERKEWLASPEAQQQRQASLTAFAGLPAAEAEALLADTFAEQLRGLNSDPARYLSDAQLVSASEDPTAGTVKEGGDSAVLDAEIPLRTEAEDGDLQKVDLSLEQTAEGYKTKNALVDVAIPDSPAGAIEVGEEEVIEISQERAAPERQARRFGDENVFYPEVLPDTDMLVSPIAGGVEIFNQLRSAESPETFRFQIEVPEGGDLRTDEIWGVEVVSNGETIARIPQPTAVDAQGTVVPVEAVVEGNSLVLQVDHREGDYAMPILLDPILENNENWIYGQNHNALDLGVWGFAKNVAGMYGSTYCIYHCFGQPSNVRGLFVSAQSGTYWANQFAHWVYGAPTPGSFITSVTLSPYVRYDHANCNAATTQYKQPHDYFGIWGNGAWNYVSVNSANYPGHSYTLPQDGQQAIFGLGSGGSNFSIPCWRDLYAAGAHVWLDDSNWPWFDWSPAVNGIPQGWVSDETPFTITSQVSDAGLGIKNVRLHHDGGPTISDIPEQNECAGTRRSPCLSTHTASFDAIHGGNFFEGERNAWLTATDATGKTVESAAWKIWVDNEAPEMTLKGQFAEATEEDKGPQQGDEVVEKLHLPVYNLEIEAKDYEPGAQPKDLRSGVKNIEIFLDEIKQVVPWAPATCNISGRCPPTLSQTYPVALSKLTTSGKHVLEVVVEDQVGKRLEREIEFEYFPATGMKDEYVMHYFPLPDGQGNETEEEHPDRPELAVNVMNGNLVYREEDIDVDGTAAVDLEVDRYYNSMLPENNDTEWGDGWTLEQTPELDPIKAGGSQVPNEAEVLDSSGAIEEGVDLPTQAGSSEFDPALQATIAKKEGGGYELTDETGESATSVAFDSTGQAEALLTDGHAKVDYTYEGGELAEIEVSDPATFAADPAELQIPEPQLITEPTYADSFGAYGSGDGQLNAPYDVAVDAQGNVWVVDRSNNRIQKFDQTGKLLSKFGVAGSGDGQFNHPTAIAVAANGDLLVADAGNSRVQRFSSAGAFVSKFGSKGTGNGQFSGSALGGLAIDATGNIWVSDTAAGRIQKFSSTGTFLQSIGTKGSAPGQLNEPSGIDVDPSGKIWVADRQNHRVSIFSPAGEFLSSLGSLGEGDGQFKNPDEVEIDNLGNAWISDSMNYRVQQFDLSGQFEAQFELPDSGAGQLGFLYRKRIATDSKGNLWVADLMNHRIQHWRVPVERPAFVHKFFMLSPADVAVGVEGNLWVVQRFGNRVQKRDPGGKSLSSFGSTGSGEGQFSQPTAIAVDRDGNLLVADSNNNRVQKFSPEGQFISQFGTGGTGVGQFSNPEGIAADFDGNIWVADSGNGRIQKFDEEGNFLGVVSSKGTEPGQLYQPVGIDVDPDGRLWVADFHNHRVSVFEEDGDFVGDFGAMGSGPGQFNGPSGLEIDAHDNVWVADQGNGRVQRFDLFGLYVGQFGSEGSGEGQFSFPASAAPVGIASDRTGRIWVSDGNNHRVQQWMLGHYHAEEPELDLRDGDAKVDVETENDLVTSVSGNAAGTHSYEYEGDFLVSHDGPEGETQYEKNAAGLLSKVTLPNGTWATIAYYSDNRVEKVTVAPGGTNAKTTQFHYQDGPPRRSHVTPPDKPQVTYDIAADGSVLKWWHKAQKPEFLAITGSLWNEREKEVSAGDLLLDLVADSPHGIASIEIIANGNQLVSEKRCEQDFSTPEIECTRLDDIWATDAASLAPGILILEVIVTDRFGDSESERWWVQIPHIPPPPPGYPVPPKFSEIQKFREDYGLEVVFPVANERELVERIYSLINAWYSPHTPAGQVARASWEEWGVPLRPEDVAELSYRQRYVRQAGAVISDWGKATAHGAYAGYYVDHRAGGVIYVGFTHSQSSFVESLRQAGILDAASRLEEFPILPQYSYDELIENQVEVGLNRTSLPGLTRVQIDLQANRVKAGTTSSTQVMDAALDAYLGADAPVEGFYDSNPPSANSRQERDRLMGRIRGGDRIRSFKIYPGWCTAGFGASHASGVLRGKSTFKHFLLTAGHCGAPGDLFYRSKDWLPKSEGQDLGRVRRNGLHTSPQVDGAAVLLEKDANAWTPRSIYVNPGTIPVTGAAVPVQELLVCGSGVTTDRLEQGMVLGPPEELFYTNPPIEGNPPVESTWEVPVDMNSAGGDSGGPVWECGTGRALGLWNAGNRPSYVTPLLPMSTSSNYEQYIGPLAPGILAKLGFGSGNLSVAP